MSPLSLMLSFSTLSRSPSVLSTAFTPRARSRLRLVETPAASVRPLLLSTKVIQRLTATDCLLNVQTARLPLSSTSPTPLASSRLLSSPSAPSSATTSRLLGSPSVTSPLAVPLLSLLSVLRFPQSFRWFLACYNFLVSRTLPFHIILIRNCASILALLSYSLVLLLTGL